MNPDPDRDARLSRIETLWSVVNRAHMTDQQDASSAQRDLLDRYGGAIRSYLRAAVRNPEVADDLFQEFAVKFLRGEFKSVDPAKGKFRSFVKTVLFRMVALHYRKLSAKKVVTVENLPEAEHLDSTEHDDDEAFLLAWRTEIIERTWGSLESYENDGGAKYNSILRARVENPIADSNELADIISQVAGKTVTPGNARVLVHRSREKFAEFMMQNIADSLEDPTREAIENELIDLRLIDYCRDALDSFIK